MAFSAGGPALAILVLTVTLTACNSRSSMAPDATPTPPQQPASPSSTYSLPALSPASPRAGSPTTIAFTITTLSTVSATALAHLTVDFGDGQRRDVGDLHRGANKIAVVHTYDHAGSFLFTAIVIEGQASSSASWSVFVR